MASMGPHRGWLVLTLKVIFNPSGGEPGFIHMVVSRFQDLTAEAAMLLEAQASNTYHVTCAVLYWSKQVTRTA